MIFIKGLSRCQIFILVYFVVIFHFSKEALNGINVIHLLICFFAWTFRIHIEKVHFFLHFDSNRSWEHTKYDKIPDVYVVCVCRACVLIM